MSGYSFEREGPLKEKGLFGLLWKQRWATLSRSLAYGFALTLYDEQGDAFPTGIVELMGASVADANDDPKHPFALKIEHPKRKTVIVEALNEAERNEWRKALSNCVRS